MIFSHEGNQWRKMQQYRRFATEYNAGRITNPDPLLLARCDALGLINVDTKWILSDGVWNDNASWYDTAVWED